MPTVAAGVWPGVTQPEYAQTHSQEFQTAMKAVLDGGFVPTALTNLERAFRKALREPANLGLQPTASSGGSDAAGPV